MTAEQSHEAQWFYRQRVALFGLIVGCCFLFGIVTRIGIGIAVSGWFWDASGFFHVAASACFFLLSSCVARSRSCWSPDAPRRPPWAP
ncbi:MAG: hypothetical protein ACYTGN_11220 [Planctomycetota bacterium]|jgi:hypothetical protein